MRLRVAARTRPVKQQHLARLLRHGAAEMLFDEVRCQRRSAGAARTGNAGAIGEKEPIGDDFLIRKGLEEILIVVPAHAGASSFHEPRTAQDEAARADADEWHLRGAHLAQVARGGLIDLGTRVQDPADDHHVVQELGCEQRAGRLNQHAAAGRDGLRAARHDGPLHVQRAAAITLVGRQPQMIDKDREGGEGEVVSQDHADAQRQPRTAVRSSHSGRHR